MAIISARQAQQLRELFEARAREPVTVILFTQQPAPDDANGTIELSCRDARTLLEEVVALAPAYLTLDVRDLAGDASEARALGIDRVPAIALHGKTAGLVRTFGVPSDYEFTTLVGDLLDLATGGQTELGERSLAALALIERPVHLRVFVTPT